MTNVERVLELENVTMQFGGVVAVDSFSMHVDRGEIVALIGPNGAGKTTAFNVITSVYGPPTAMSKCAARLLLRAIPRAKCASFTPVRILANTAS